MEHDTTTPIAADPKRILVVCMRRIGDMLLATTLIRSVRRAWPEARLEVLVNAGSAGVLEGNPDIDRLWVQPERGRDVLKLMATLWRRYDLAITALYNDRPHLWTLMASKLRAGVVPPKGHVGATWKRWSLKRWCELEPESIHAAEGYLRIVDALGIPRVPEVVPPRAPPRRDDDDAQRYAVVHPSPMYRYKRWTVEGWRALLRHLVGRGFAVKLTGGPAAADRELSHEIVSGLGGDERARIDDLTGQRSLAELTPLIEGAALFVGPDTSVTHLAAATGTPTVALFGPSDPIVWGPVPIQWHGKRDERTPWQRKRPLQHAGNVWLVQGEGDCVPCMGEGCDKHRDSRSQCLDELSAERVIDAVERALDGRQVESLRRQRTS